MNRPTYRIRFSLPLLCGCLLGAVALAADPAPQAEKKGGSSLDEQLLKGLGDLDGDPLTEDLLPQKPAGEADKAKKSDATGKPASGPAKQKMPEADNPLDKQLLEGLTDGEDLGESGDPLVRLGQKMREAGGLIGETKSGEPTQQLQQKIVADLDQLIKMARQQQQQQSSSSSPQQAARREQVKQSKPAGSPGEQHQQNEPAKDSTKRLGKNEVRRPDMAEMNDMIKRVWGQLPEKEREQMLQNSVDQFLPKYELQIEAYFKSLVERQQQGPRK